MWRFITRTNSQDKKEKEVSFDNDKIGAVRVRGKEWKPDVD